MSRLTVRLDMGWAEVEEVLYSIPSDSESGYDIHDLANEYTSEEFMSKYGYTEEEKVLPRECADVLEQISLKLCDLEDVMEKHQIETVEELDDVLKEFKKVIFQNKQFKEIIKVIRNYCKINHIEGTDIYLF